MAYIQHDFYCLKCGQKGLPVWRNNGHLHTKNHRKKLYCFNCQCEVNHIEITNQNQLEKFKKDFQNGVYIDEAEESISTCKNSKK